MQHLWRFRVVSVCNAASVEIPSGVCLKCSISSLPHVKDADHLMLDVWWIKSHWYWLFLEHFGFLLSLSFRHCPILLFVKGQGDLPAKVILFWESGSGRKEMCC